MKKLLFLLLLIPFLGNSQATFTAPVGYNTGSPTATPSGVGTRWRIDLLTGKKYTWLPGSLSWDEDAQGIDRVSGCSAPLYTPGYNQSDFAVNGCTSGQGGPKMYQWNGSTWDCLNCTGYIAGTGIDITGGVISNTAPNIVQELSISGQDLTLSGGGGTVAIPNIYTADGTLTNNRVVAAGDKLFEIRAFNPGTGQYPAFKIESSQIAFFYEYDDGIENKRSDLSANQNAIELTRKNAANEQYKLTGTDAGWIFSQQDVSEFKGAGYDTYYPDVVTSDYSFPSMAHFKQSTIPLQPRQLEDSAAREGETFYSTDRLKLCYKDPGGTVNELY